METKSSEKKEVFLLKILPLSYRKMVESVLEQGNIQEIRLRVRKPAYAICDGKEISLKSEHGAYYTTKEDLKELLECISRYSLYAYEQELKNGYITIEGGHRVGVAGKVVMEGDKIRNMKYISSVNIRVSHEIKNCANRILPYLVKDDLMCHTLIISPPGCGKTTLLRDVIRQISYGSEWMKGCTVGVVDERSEIGGCYKGIMQNDIGPRTDILDCCSKSDGMMLLIRSMSPRVLAIDEIGSKEDMQAVEYAMNCGCKMLATVHGNSLGEIRKKPYFQNWISQKRFERYVVLTKSQKPGRIGGVYDERGSLLYKEV